VITYFPHDVDKVAEIIEKEFKIDKENSVDKRKSLDIDRFGYLSLHYVASLVTRRGKLIEYQRFANMRFELQIRSTLQHAWAEIEHDLGYKTEGELPQEMRRRFSRLAGLLELADEEFERLREDITQYEKRVDETIKSAPQTLMIDQSTVVAALGSEKALIKLDEAVADAANLALREKIDAAYVGREARELKTLGIDNISQLMRYATVYQEHIACFVRHWVPEVDPESSDKDPFYRGIGLFYLGYALAAQRDDSQLVKWGIGIKGRDEDLLTEVRLVWAKVIKQLGPPKKI
jgi:putative GTP pyrophosphokinase